MTVKELLEIAVKDRAPIALLLLIAATCIQISPININPWDSIFKWIGSKLNKDVVEKIDDLECRLAKHIEESNVLELRQRRTLILDFASSLTRGVNFTKEKFDFVIAECDSYQKYCRDNGIPNGVADASIDEIRRIYRLHLSNNDFLTETAKEDSE